MGPDYKTYKANVGDEVFFIVDNDQNDGTTYEWRCNLVDLSRYSSDYFSTRLYLEDVYEVECRAIRNGVASSRDIIWVFVDDPNTMRRVMQDELAIQKILKTQSTETTLR